MAAFISEIFGVNEPAIYGVTLPRKKYFIISCIGAAMGGALVAILEVRLYIFGGLGIFQYPCFINPATNDVSGMYNGMIVSAVSFVAGLAMTLPLYKDEVVAAPAAAETPAPDPAASAPVEVVLKGEDLVSPLTGNTVALPNVPDPVFASGMMGKGLAVEPTVGKVFAPADAEVKTLFRLEKLTAAHVAQGDKVTKGQLLIELIKNAGYQ